MLRTLIALVFAFAFACVAMAQVQSGIAVISASTANPATGTATPGPQYRAALCVVTVDDGGSHAVTVESKACAACPWVSESAMGGTATPSAPHQVRVVGYFHQLRFSVSNAGGDVVNAWCTFHN